MGLFKRAAARGVAHELVRNKLAAFPSKEAMDEAADAVADAHEGMPEVSGEGGHSPEHLAEVANKLMEIAHAMMAEAGQAGAAPAEELGKEAAAADYEDLAVSVAVQCMEKSAAEVKQAGALVEGGDKGNSPEQAAQVGEVAKLDEKQRPQGTYQVAMGDTALDTSKGHIGDLSKSDKTPKNSPEGSNSVNEDAKKAELAKIANKLVGLHDGKNENSPSEAAKHDTVAQLDQKQRPQGKYLVGQGNANIKEPADARIGKEMPHPNGPKNSPSGTNSVIEASKVSEEDAFLTLFKKTAADVGPYLPTMSDDEKVAAITRMIGYNHDERQNYLNELHKVAEDKSVGMKGDESKHGLHTDHNKYKKDPEHKDEIGHAQKKESALLTRIREIAASSAN